MKQTKKIYEQPVSLSRKKNNPSCRLVRTVAASSPVYGEFQQPEDVGGQGGQSEVVPLRPDLRHHHTPADICLEVTEQSDTTLNARRRCDVTCDVTFLPGDVQRLSVQERSSSSLSVEQFVLHAAVHDPKLCLTAQNTPVSPLPVTPG